MADKDNSAFMGKMFGLFNLGLTKRGSLTPMPSAPLGGSKGLKKSAIKSGGVGERYTTLQRLWQFFLQETVDTSDTLKNRELRYLDLDLMIKNDTVIQMAADLYADEAVQCAESGKPVQVNAKSDVQSYIEDLLQQWDYTQQNAREIIYNKVVYGDAFDGNEVSEKDGITGVTPLSIHDVKDRIEFNPSIILERYNINSGFTDGTKGQKLHKLLQDLSDKAEDPVSYFKKYLFGFELASGVVVPPWSITHFRTFSMQREFFPWGRSRFINALPTFKQLMAAKTLMQVARAASFPRDFYGVATAAGMTPTEQWEAVEEFNEQLDNAGLSGGSKELPAIGARITMPKELANYEQLTNTIDLDQIADIEYLRDDEIIATSVPKGYLIVDSGGWGQTGQSLLQQFKPFGRKVFADQSDFLKELTLKIKTHLTIVNKFQGWDTPFELTMQFPVIEESTERQQHRQEEINMANTALDLLKQLIGVDSVPAAVVKDAFSTLTSLPQQKLIKWIDELEAEKKRAADEQAASGGGGETGDDGFGDPSLYEKVSNRFDAKAKDRFREELIRLQSRYFKDGFANGIHYRTSLYEDSEMRMQHKLLESAMESGLKSNLLKEQVKSFRGMDLSESGE
jgi:hypothetical protein